MKTLLDGVRCIRLTSMVAIMILVCTSAHANGKGESCWADAGPITNGFQLKAELSVPTVRPGEPVTLNLTVKNVSDQVLLLAESYPMADFVLRIEDGSGNEISAGKTIVEIGRMITRKVQPGEEISYTYPLSSVPAVAVAGIYHITASRRFYRPDGDGCADLVSNTVTLVVSDDPQNVQGSTSPGITSANKRMARPLTKDAKPRLVDVRQVLERHNCSLVWDPDKRKAIVTANGLRAAFTADSDILVMGDKEIKMWSAAKLVNGRLCAPGDAVSQITASCAVSSIDPKTYGLPGRLSKLTDLRQVSRRTDISSAHKTDVLVVWLTEERRQPTPTSKGLGGGDINSSYIQAQIIKGLAEVGNPLTLRAIDSDDKADANVRDGARIALCLMGDSMQIPRMVHIIESGSEPFFRVTAAEALGGLRAAEAIPALERALLDDYTVTGGGCRPPGPSTIYSVREAAQTALRVLKSDDPELEKYVQGIKGRFEQRLAAARKEASGTP